MLFHTQEEETTQHLTPSALSTVSLPVTNKCMVLKKNNNNFSLKLSTPTLSWWDDKRTLGFINFRGKLEILLEKLNGLFHSVWEASENVDCDLRQ